MRGRRWRRGARLAAELVALLGILWCAGFLWFLHLVPARVADPDSETDAIVVLTGGSLRVENGLALLAAGKAKKLFVSGVYHGVDVGELLRVSRQSPERVQCCIVLGHTAESTLGNALETAAFMTSEGYGSLRLVTASYHMPRSLVEFTRAMPKIRIVPHPVFPDIVQDWWMRPSGIELYGEEYVKFLGALARPYLPFVR
ncbi:MAG TPA: YdcF family protein [Stellaceae bacterium]|nr:YdcF family protein [Stellaceae bacterium]